MKVRMSSVQPRESVTSTDQQVRVEIQSFLEALNSYPALFARNPNITFDQHLSTLVSESKTRLVRRN